MTTWGTEANDVYARHFTADDAKSVRQLVNERYSAYSQLETAAIPNAQDNVAMFGSVLDGWEISLVFDLGGQTVTLRCRSEDGLRSAIMMDSLKLFLDYAFRYVESQRGVHAADTFAINSNRQVTVGELEQVGRQARFRYKRHTNEYALEQPSLRTTDNLGYSIGRGRVMVSPLESYHRVAESVGVGQGCPMPVLAEQSAQMFGGDRALACSMISLYCRIKSAGVVVRHSPVSLVWNASCEVHKNLLRHTVVLCVWGKGAKTNGRLFSRAPPEYVLIAFSKSSVAGVRDICNLVTHVQHQFTFVYPEQKIKFKVALLSDGSHVMLDWSFM